MEKGIKVDYERIIVGGRRKIRVLALKALTKDELPKQYLDSDDYTIFYDPEFELLSSNFSTILEVDGIYDPEDFKAKLGYIKRAGHRLTKINKEIRGNNWHGTRSVTF